MEPVHCERLDYSFIQNRLCADDGIRTKSVLILGCGSLGGYIASNLCQYGITSLDILDKDYYSPENACRHWLGFCGEAATKIINKADLLKNRLYSMYPYVDIDSLNYEDRSVEAFIEDIVRLSRYDLIISALGEPTLNLEINRLLYQNGICTPFLCCFNEPYGIGGHSIIVNIDKDSCLECLYTSCTSNEQVTFRGSFVEENQNFSKNMSGCAGSFVPYSNLDSQQTAICVARMAIDVLNGKIVHNTMCSWLGSRHTSLFPNIGDIDEYYKEHYWIKTIKLDQTNDFAESYPDRAAIKHLDEVALQLSNNTQKSRCGYYGIAHTPMIFRFGFKMGDSGRNVMLFHKLRHGEVNFNELSDVLDGKGVYVFEKNKSIKSDELIVSIATSAQINEQNLVDLNPKNKHIIMFDSLNYDVDYITSKVTIQYIKDSILTYVRMRVKEYGMQKLHIVIASSVAFTFALGQSFSNQMDPQIVVYHYANGNYYWGICVNKDYDDPKCIEFTSACDN